MKKVFTFLTVLFVLSSSGCTVPFLNIEIPFLPDIFPGMQVTEERHDVISIESLQAIPFSTVRSGQSIRLRTVVRNLQKPEYEPIENVVIGLYNDCGMFDDVKVEFCQGSKSDGKDPSTEMYQCTLNRMYPQSTAIVEWVLKAKSMNVETTCKIGILAKYDYTTYSTTSVTFINKAELERLVSEGKSFSEAGIAIIGEGPIKPYIEVLSQPIVIDSNKEKKEAGSGIMSFWIENKGFGLLDISESTTENVIFENGCENFKTMKRIENTDTKRICLEIKNADNRIEALKDNEAIEIQKCIEGYLENKEDEKTIHSIGFIKKQTPKYSCTIIHGEPGKIKQEKTYQITAKVVYSYKFTKEIMLTVQPKIKL